jgi:hypothetical protein
MSAPSEDQILEKAKELCRCEGKAWNLDDFENGVSGVTMLTVVADDNDRTYYLNRAKAFLKQKYPRRAAGGEAEEESRVIDKFALQRGAGWSHYELEAREDTTARPRD